MYRFLIKPILFLFDAEKVHHFVADTLIFISKRPFLLGIIRKCFTYTNPLLVKEVAGLTFRNPIGLAAGFDKNAELVDAMDALGFGCIEIGTVTPRPQPGNEKPRLFRFRADEALVNRMGFNNKGADVAAARLRGRQSKILVGGNVGKNKTTPNERAIDDYLACFDALYEVVDYFVVNVSSPNTPGLRELQEKTPLKNLLDALQRKNSEKPKKRPIFLKIAPDLTNEQLDDIVGIVQETKITGVIAANTTLSRASLKTPATKVAVAGAGGLSGKPLKHRSTEVIRYICEKSSNSFPVIGVGGISSAADVEDKLKAGAALVQVYTGFIYEGPGMVSRLCRELAWKLKNAS